MTTAALPPTDQEGHLLNLADWSPDAARLIARHAGLELTPEHWRIIQIVRNYHERHHLSPAMRPLVRCVRRELGEACGSSLYLLRLFPGSPARLAARIAGLPRPTNCL